MSTSMLGQLFFNCDTHSIPFMPGILMSMRTTSGASAGILRNASLASACDPTQRNSATPSKNLIRLSRMSRWSSTTENLIINTFHSSGSMADYASFCHRINMRGRQLRRRPQKNKGNGRAATDPALDETFAADLAHALSHIAQPVCQRIVRCLRETTPVVLNDNLHTFRRESDLQPDIRCLGMFDDILQGFFDRQKDIVADIAGQVAVRRVLWDIQKTIYPGSQQIIHRELAGVVNQMPKCVVARIDGPDNFIERFYGLSRGIGDFPQTLVNLLVADNIAQHGNQRQARAKVIMDVLGNASALPLNG